MKVEIWSDIMCPFCYIGKRRFEAALSAFPAKDQIEVEWKSFQLNPDLQPVPGRDIYDYVAQIKGQSREWSLQVHRQMTENARQEGLTYNFDKAVIANSFDAHRLIQFAKQQQLGDAMEERLFLAYFTEGQDISNRDVLTVLGTEIGLEHAAVATMLASDAFGAEVEADCREAQLLGAGGVPFFVLDRKYGVAGAQPAEAFTRALEQAFGEWRSVLQTPEGLNGEVCTPDGHCS